MTCPQLFVIGDSISMTYGPFLETMTQGIFEYGRKGGNHDPVVSCDKNGNGGDSSHVLSFLQALEKAGFRSDILLINCGLHDIKTDRDSSHKQVAIGAYERNLCDIARLALKSAGRVVWVRTTPVDFERHRAHKPFDRYEEDVNSYNAAADSVMAGAGITIADLYTFTVNLGPDALRDDGVHFRPEAGERQAAFLAGYLDCLAHKSGGTA